MNNFKRTVMEKLGTLEKVPSKMFSQNYTEKIEFGNEGEYLSLTIHKEIISGKPFLELSTPKVHTTSVEEAEELLLALTKIVTLMREESKTLST